jgi:hypothetical protein
MAGARHTIAVGMVIIVATYIRRRRGGIIGWRPPNSNEYGQALGGSLPKLPAPDWVHWADSDTDSNNDTDPDYRRR